MQFDYVLIEFEPILCSEVMKFTKGDDQDIKLGDKQVLSLQLFGRIDNYVNRDGSICHTLEDEKVRITKNQYSKSQTSFSNNLGRNKATTATEWRTKVRREDTNSSMDQTNTFDMNTSYEDIQYKTQEGLYNNSGARMMKITSS